MASLAKSGQLPEKLVQEKRVLDELEQANDANSKIIQEQRNRVIEVYFTKILKLHIIPYKNITKKNNNNNFMVIIYVDVCFFIYYEN